MSKETTKKASVKTIGSALAELDTFLGRLEKEAAERGNTEHPVMGADDGTVAPNSGERDSENTSDIKKDIGPTSVDASSAATEQEAKPVALTTATTTGEGVPPVKGDDTKEQEDTEHVSKNAQEFLATVKQACLEQGAEKVAIALGNELMADIAVYGDELEKAAAAGAGAADQDVQASIQNALPGMIQHVTKEAEAAAELLFDTYARLEKQAAEEGNQEVEEGVPGDTGEEGDLPPEDISQLTQMAQGGQGGAGAEGGVPPEAMGAMGAEGAEGGMGGAGDSEVIEALSQALEDAGITPEELAQAVEQQQGGEQAPLEQKMAKVQTAKTAAAEVNRHRNLKSVGRIGVKRASISLAWQMRQMVREVTGK